MLRISCFVAIQMHVPLVQLYLSVCDILKIPFIPGHHFSSKHFVADNYLLVLE